MVIQPRIKGFICTTAHPDGCARDVAQQIAHVRAGGAIKGAPQRVLVIGASNGYGLATRITAAFGASAQTMGVFLERPSQRGKPASAGWYKAAAFQRAAREQGLYALSVNGDAFAPATKQLVMQRIREDWGQVDLVVYSLAAPLRTLADGSVVRSAIKPIGAPFAGATIDVTSGELRQIEVAPAEDAEIATTVQVMGGEDWQAWIEALGDAGLLADGARTINYTYIGSEITWPIYHHGTIGRAKEDLDRAARELQAVMSRVGGDARICVMKGLLTQASSAIPGLPLYFALMFRVMKAEGTHEGCIEQADRLLRTQLYGDAEMRLDDAGRVRMDDLEMADTVQSWVRTNWGLVEAGNLDELTDAAGYRQAFLQMYGFGFDDIDYAAEVDPEVAMEVLEPAADAAG